MTPTAEAPTRLDADTTVGTVGLVYPGLDELLLGRACREWCRRT